MAERFCKVCKGWHDLDKPWPDNCIVERNWARSDLPAPMFIQDEMPPTKSMVDGRYYTSKAALRATYRPSGNKEGKYYTEVGNEQPKPFKKPKPDRKKIRASLDKAFSQAGLGA